MKFTIILPIYGNSPWLNEAIDSVLDQQSNNWRLIIADDGSDKSTKQWLGLKINKLNDHRIKWIQRAKNLGLFGNVNQAIKESDTEWIILLCSDDILKRSATSLLEQLNYEWPQVDLILSTFESINSDGSLRDPDSSLHHDQLRRDTGLIKPEEIMPAMLRLGSLNGNLTGMAFTKEHWLKVGPFKENWRHAADWEWLIRASEVKTLLLNRTVIASVRTHESQLSNQNRRSGHELIEISKTVEYLIEHKLLEQEPNKWRWAGHIMQHQLWNSIKAVASKSINSTAKDLSIIHKTTGLRNTLWSMLLYMPIRIEKRLSGLRKQKAHQVK